MYKKTPVLLIITFIALLLTGCTFMYDIFGPSAPSGLIIEQITSFSVRISWKMNQDFEYLVSYSSSDGSDSAEDTNIGKISYYVIENLKPSTDYTITLKAKFNEKRSSGTQSLPFTTLLAPPGDVSISAHDKNAVFVSWSPIQGADGYILYYDTDGSLSHDQSIDCKADNYYVLSGLSESTPYYFAIAAYNSGGTGDKSPVKSYTTKVINYLLGFYELPAADTVLHLTGLQNNRIFMVKMNPSRSLIRADDTRSIKTIPASAGSRSSTHDLTDNTTVTAEEGNSLVSGMWNSGFTRYDKPEPRDIPINPDFIQTQSASYDSVGSRNASDRNSNLSRSVNLHDKRNFWVENATGAWVEKTAILSSIGTYSYVWIAEENLNASSASSSDNLVTHDQLKVLTEKFDSMYSPVTTIFGNKYAVQSSGLIPPQEKISILVYDIDGDYEPSQNSGVFGYFWEKDFYLGGANGTIDYYNLKTNEDELFYLDVHFLDVFPAGMYSTLAHEFQHMLHYIQKSVGFGYQSSVWYNEMLSLVCEDLVSQYLDVGLEDGPQSRLPEFIYSYYESGLMDWLSGDDVLKSYAGIYTFGAFITRNYGGAQFIKDIASSRSVDNASINDALKKSSSYANDTFDTLYKAFGRSLCYPDIPLSYALPSLNITSSVTVGSYDYTVFPINLQNYSYYAGSEQKYGLMMFDSSNYGNVDLRPYGVSVHYWGKGSGNVSLEFTPSHTISEKIYIIVE